MAEFDLDNDELEQLTEKMQAAAAEGIRVVGGARALDAALHMLMTVSENFLETYKSAIQYGRENGTDPIVPVTPEVTAEHTKVTLALGLVCCLMEQDALGLGADSMGYDKFNLNGGGKPN